MHWSSQYTESMETLAYMPAVWMMFQTDQKLLAFDPLSQVVSQRQSVWFLSWMLAYNGYEDVIRVWTSGFWEPHFIAGHILHFLTVIDFSVLLLQQAFGSKVAKCEEISSSGNLSNLSLGCKEDHAGDGQGD